MPELPSKATVQGSEQPSYPPGSSCHEVVNVNASLIFEGRLMMERTSTISPRCRARVTGAVYLLYFLTSVLGAVVSGGLAPTASTILANETSFRWGFALGLVSSVCYVAVVGLFYRLFRHVGRSAAFLAVLFGLMGSAISAVGSLFQLGPLVVVGRTPFTADQLQGLSQIFVDMSAQAGYIALVFFGVFQLLIGYLIVRSTFLPRILGGLIALAGLGWFTFLSPPLANHVMNYLYVFGFVAELILMLWLLLVGVNVERWNALARSAEVSSL